MPPRGYLLNDVTVTSAAAGEYTVQLYPVNCSYPFSVMSVRNGQAPVSRVESASPPVTGTFDLMYNSQTIRGIITHSV